MLDPNNTNSNIPQQVSCESPSRKSCSKKPQKRSGPEISPARNGSKWIRPNKRAAIYARDGFQCVYCGSQSKLSLDHVKPTKNNTPSNLVTCCISCNSAKQRVTSRAWYQLLRKKLSLTLSDTRKIQSKVSRLLKKPI